MGATSGDRRGHNENAAADRGLTTDDVAESAMEDAGLKTPRVGDARPVPKVAPPRPQIGDSRPAAAASESTGGSNGGANGGSSRGPGEPGDGNGAGERTGAPRKRRRRGGKNRSRGGNGAGGNGAGGSRPQSGGGNRSEVVTSAVSADDGLDLEDLDDETLARRRGKTRKGRPTGRYQMVVHVDDNGVIQMAVLEGRVLTEHYVSRSQDDATSIDGNIYLGKVQNVLPGMEAAFVDIGTPKNGVLYRGDVSFDTSEVEEAQPKIERLLKNGQPVLVQVTKNPIGAKGARLTQEVSLAGRFVVMVPNQPTTYGISKRLPDDERRRLRKVLEGIRPENAGLIVRTAAEGATPEELERDLARLQDQWKQISSLVDRGKPAKLLYQEPALVVRVIREEFTKEYRSIVIDDPALYDDVKGYVEAIAPELAERVELVRRSRPADLRAVPRARAAAQGARPQGVAPVGRLAHHRADRGADGHRRQHRQERREVEPRGDGLQQQPGGGRRGGPAAAAAGHRRDHRHRLHRHGDPQEPRRGRSGRSGRPWAGTRPAPRCSTSPSWASSR